MWFKLGSSMLQNKFFEVYKVRIRNKVNGK